MLKIFNTLSSQKEEFVPLSDNEVRMYACGVTVYDHSHLGHARGAVMFDVVRKYLQRKGYKVKYVRNFTDVDDKIIKRAAASGISWKELAEKYTQEYIKDMAKLGVDRPDIEPKATDHIQDIIDLIGRLAAQGLAYESGGDVFFAVRKFPGYGKLSKKTIDDMLSGARIDVNERKTDPLDFVLWKASKPGEPSWDSPWGKGRPGWHIECSAMSMKYLGETFDIHAGGMDLQFPHHENEIAQAEGATGKQFVRYWMHNGFVNVNREKMSKSLGNFFTIKEILEAYEPEVIRFFLLSTHYRNPIDFSNQSLQDSRAALDRYYTMLEALNNAIGADYKPGPYTEDQMSPAANAVWHAADALMQKFDEAMEDDFNTASAIGAVFEMVREINRVVSDAELIKNDPHIKDALAQARDALLAVSRVLNLFGREPEEWFGRSLDKIRIKESGEKLAEIRNGLSAFGAELAPDGSLSPGVIDMLISERNSARSAKAWKKADEIRDLLARMNVELLDSTEGTKWQIKE